ncbi:hypothetical protein JOC77_001518 [Peribacillus deserti]|uniref:Uncharacterized protein n=1 Tax=Peribacillus deserti TaxID=673318 RepID=A0ABS2QG02_9BACI|nr:hypothetical protein [Peribacillus deserti]
MACHPDKQFNKVLKDNEILPRWVEICREGDHVKPKLKMFDERYDIDCIIKMSIEKSWITKWADPRMTQKRGIRLD